MRSFFLCVIAVFGSTLAACDQGPTDYVVTIKTEYGEMTAILYDETPKHKANFIKLAKEHYFDGTLFHRVIKDFMIQGGDPDSKTVKPGQPLGNGGPGYSIPEEINSGFYHEKGALSAARLSDNVNPKKESSGSQFYVVQGHVVSPAEMESLKIDDAQLDAGLRQIMGQPRFQPLRDSLRMLQQSGDEDAFIKKIYSLAPRVERETHLKVFRNYSPEQIKAYETVGGAPHLDNEYTVFGKVVKGLNVIDKIASIPCDDADRPIKDVQMTVTVEEVAKSKITSLYGYHYPDEKK
jgi:cyclophilin family peptidyl-prolyl cis-trans isomerase